MYFRFAGIEGIPKNPSIALQIWSEARNKSGPGVVESTYSHAMCSLDGVGTDKDPSAAYKALNQLCEEHNYGRAYYSIALMLMEGNGVPKNEKEAFSRLKQAYEKNVPPATYNLANCYAEGKGTGKNLEKAFELYELAVRQAKFLLEKKSYPR